MAIEHHKLGCIRCGKRRKLKDVVSGVYDVYVRDIVSKSLMRVGFCKACFEAGLINDVAAIKTKLHESEKKFRKENGKPEKDADIFKHAQFDKTIGFKNYWTKFSKNHPEGVGEMSKTPSKFLDVIDEE